MKRHYTILEAALTVGVLERTFHSLLREGKIKGFKRGGRWIMPRKELGNISIRGENI